MKSSDPKMPSLRSRRHGRKAVSAGAHEAPSLASLGGWRALLANPGLVLNTWRHGGAVGRDGVGNQYFEERHATRPDGRARRWVMYAGGARDASLVPPEWHAWLHFTTDAPLSEAGRRDWQRPHQPNLTGTPWAYRPRGHDYLGGQRAGVSADYEPWTPDA
ncbi:NADH:ubiquinone oxidoreductase subunit NDUFA12 [Acidiphilium acidophilum]|uniref:NADH:ubiquinone oxidoreductase subunit NDUFA12 n=1 Tax=Acidiphilium acidophilum TaxID=76588 RepID=UPI002E8E7857|nr:NADH:ubiquinone oxidoreductase subunit NDUFA12 [Acidiphilium acidophilum]